MFSSALVLLVAVLDIGTAFEGAGWKVPAETFVDSHRTEGFEFADSSHAIANCLKRGTCTWYGLDVWESRVYYGKDGAERVELSLYNRGDARENEVLDQDGVNSLLDKIAEKAEPGGKIGRNPTRTKQKTGGYRFERRFTKGSNDVDLVWGVNGAKKETLSADFVRVTLRPSGTKRANSSRSVSQTQVRKNVIKAENGDVYIGNVPMVDQGKKGYCSVATSERIARYYGFDIDEHEIAQLAGTTAGRGTSSDSMIKAVQAVGARCRLTYGVVISFHDSIKKIQRGIEAYNRMAKTMKRKTISFDQFIVNGTFRTDLMTQGMEGDVLLATRKRMSEYKKFLAGVKMWIDRGVPLFWSVTLGVFPEPDIPQAQGGHMRLIIGYNSETHEIIYTDTWGFGHELKRMPEERAVAISQDLFFLRP